VSLSLNIYDNDSSLLNREKADRGAAAATACRLSLARPSCGARLQKQLNSKRMTKQQLIEKVAAKTELKKSEVEVAVDSVLAMIAEALQANERVDLRGFGSFVVKERKERQGRNPRTGETITIAAKRDASFKPGKELTEKLAQHETPPIPEEVPPPSEEAV
jgi:DNA-binding protein HU-beta